MKNKKNKKDKSWLSKKQKCVWNALYMGIYDLTIVNVKSYYDILNIIKINLDFTKNIVKWNNKLLSKQELLEITEAINNIIIENSYNCGACDPLLIAFCNVFNCNIHHDFYDNLMLYKVQNPIRTIYLSSLNVFKTNNQNGHMEHIKNKD